MLALGSSLAQYRILSALGAGGMGEVYLAEDTRLHRRVALKVLPAGADDETARRRLIREAHAAATLDHPNICTVFDVGEDSGRAFIAMQFVDGRTLAARLADGPLDLAAALAVAGQAAAALDEAHRHGVVHRDIKPQNIMLTAGRQVKVLDFGLAKLAAVPDDVRTATVLTGTGMVAGTVRYMSPEQLRGEPVDARTDIFSFGIVLYEMIAGAHPFASRSGADTMAAILGQEPPPLRASGVPPEVQRIVRKCLEKDRERRYQTARDLAIDLDNIAREAHDAGPASTGSAGAQSGEARRAARRWRSLAAYGAAGVAIAAAAAWFAASRRDRPLHLSPADFTQLTDVDDSAAAPALSPDGRMIAFIRDTWFLGTGDIYVKQLPDGEAVRLTHDPRPKYGPAFSPDGTRVAYTAISDFGLPTQSWDTWTVPVLGGEPARLLPNAAGLTWIAPHRVLFSEIEEGSGLHMGIVTAGDDRDGERRVYFPPHPRAMAHLSALSPDQRSVLVVEMNATAEFEPCRLLPFDGSSAGRAVGPPERCVAASWSPDGRMMYFTAGPGSRRHLWRQRFPDGVPEQLTSGTATTETGLAIAPDGRSLVTAIGTSEGSLWLHDSGGDRRIPIEGSVLSNAVLSPDGQRIYCLVSSRSLHGLSIVDVASSKMRRVLTSHDIADFDISSDERSVAFSAAGPGRDRQIWLASLEGRTPPKMIAGHADEVHFAGRDALIYRTIDTAGNHLARIGTNGQGASRVFDRPIIDVLAVAPAGDWAIVERPMPDNPSSIVMDAIPLGGGAPRTLCGGTCTAGWSTDRRLFVIAPGETPPGAEAGNTPPAAPPTGPAPGYAFRLAAGRAFPELPAGMTLADWAGVNGALTIASDSESASVGSDPATYVFVKRAPRGNLFRVPLK